MPPSHTLKFRPKKSLPTHCTLNLTSPSKQKMLTWFKMFSPKIFVIWLKNLIFDALITIVTKFQTQKQVTRETLNTTNIAQLGKCYFALNGNRDAPEIFLTCMNTNQKLRSINIIIIIIIIKRQFIMRSNMATVTIRAPYNVRCSYSATQSVSEVGTCEKMCV